jgi:hypothetical protein
VTSKIAANRNDGAGTPGRFLRKLQMKGDAAARLGVRVDICSRSSFESISSAFDFKINSATKKMDSHGKIPAIGNKYATSSKHLFPPTPTRN